MVIACADESLIEQLVKPEGDIAKLARHLDLVIDARLGKSPDQYLCLKKLDQARIQGDEEMVWEDIASGLPDFVYSSAPMQTFHAYGDRAGLSAARRRGVEENQLGSLPGLLHLRPPPPLRADFVAGPLSPGRRRDHLLA